MKINIKFDTDNAKNFVKNKTEEVWNKADSGHILLTCVSIILASYVISEKVGNLFNKNSCCVDVVLEKPNKTLPKTKIAQLFNTHEKLNLNEKEFNCLAKNIYWETMHEPLLGQIAVAHVTYNRVLSGNWGNSFCDVVYAPKQFSWTNFRKIKNAHPKNEKQWNRATHSAQLFTNGLRVTNLDTSEFYYAQYIKKPKWAHTMSKTAHIGQHIFFAKNGDE